MTAQRSHWLTRCFSGQGIKVSDSDLIHLSAMPGAIPPGAEPSRWVSGQSWRTPAPLSTAPIIAVVAWWRADKDPRQTSGHRSTRLLCAFVDRTGAAGASVNPYRSLSPGVAQRRSINIGV